MASISSIGVGSGLDLEGLVTDILKAERAPQETRLNQREGLLQASISALGSLKSTLADFQDSLAGLKTASAFSKRSAGVSDTSLVSVKAGNTADNGRYTIEVLNLARTQKLATADFASASTTVGSGSLTIGSGSNSFDVTITAGVNDTLAGIRDAINNADSNSSVRASILTVDAGQGDGSTVSKLVLTANNSGASNAISVDVVDDDGVNTDTSGLSQLFYNAGDPNSRLSVVEAAQDARITVDGFVATSSTNVFSNVIDDVTITALREGDDPLAPPSSTLTVTEDKSAVNSAVKLFVESYNALITVFNKLTNYDQASNTRGLLSGDSSVNVMETQIRRALGNVVGGNSVLTNLSSIGIATNRDGTVRLDETALNTAITNNFDEVSTLFSGEEGVAQRLDNLITGFLRSDGVFNTRERSLQTQLRKVDDQRATMELRLGKMESRIRAQFSALDALVQQLNQTSDFLGRQLDASAQIVNRNSNKS